jgi:hypothetical protein
MIKEDYERKDVPQTWRQGLELLELRRRLRPPAQAATIGAA